MKQATTQKKTIKLLTYNVFLRPPPIKTNEDDYKNQRLNDILDNIQNFDIICFQEMFQTATFRKQKLIQKAIQKGFCYWKDSETPSFWRGPPVDAGLLVISRYPILFAHFQSYQVGVLSDSASDKVQGKILHLFTTHLQASYLHPGMLLERQLSIKTRIHQFRTLLEKINQHLKNKVKKSEDELVMLVGDLNMNALMLPCSLHQKTILFDEKVGTKFNQYQTFLKIFKDFNIKATNCGLKKYQKHPVTFGDGDKILTDELQSLSKQSLDFIFSLQVPIKLSIPKINSNGSKQHITTDSESSSLTPIISSTKVEEFKIKDRQYIQLSDHYGMSIEVLL